MLRDAFNEIRLHPGRFVATLLAIAISVGFVAAISILVNTEKEAIGRSGSLSMSKADVVVQGHAENPTAVAEAIKGVEGVTAVASIFSQMMMMTNEDATQWVTATSVPPEEFRWSELANGRWPQNQNEVALSSDGLAKLKVQLGGTVHMGESSGPEVTVVGETRDARSLFGVVGYIHLPPEAEEMGSGSWVVKTSGNPADVVPAVQAAVDAVANGAEITVSTGEEARSDAITMLTGGLDVFKYMLLAFAGVALVVGIIIISNTFTILVTQRRRQIGLLRAVGASSGQVRGRLILEALIIGVAGSVLGLLLGLAVAAIGAGITGSIFWGLVLNPGELIAAMLVGVIVTLISVLGPSLAATQVKPLEALQVVPTAAQAKRLSTLRIVVCSIFLLGGLALLGLSFAERTYSLVWAMGAGALLTVAILGSAPLYIAAILRLLGKIFGFAGPTTRLAAENAARNPQRAAATAVALMLAVGLVVTLQVALSSTRSSAMQAINEQFPIDITVSSAQPLDPGYIDAVRKTPGVATLLEVQSKRVEAEYGTLDVRNVNPAREQLGLSEDLGAPDDAIVVNTHAGLPTTVSLPGVAGPVELRVVPSEGTPYGMAAVSTATFEKLAGETRVAEFWVKLTDRTSSEALNAATRAIEQGPEDKRVEGGAIFAGLLETILNVLLIVLTALLGVAVLIALVGVGNTLGLSVIERQRESALLRALGMQRGGLRAMLLIEALMLALVGTVIGILAGAFFGWLAISSALRMFPTENAPELVFSVDPWWTLLLIVVCVGAACLASILPGRRAANATPTEALAAE